MHLVSSGNWGYGFVSVEFPQLLHQTGIISILLLHCLPLQVPIYSERSIIGTRTHIDTSNTLESQWLSVLGIVYSLIETLTTVSVFPGSSLPTIQIAIPPSNYLLYVNYTHPDAILYYMNLVLEHCLSSTVYSSALMSWMGLPIVSFCTHCAPNKCLDQYCWVHHLT